MQLGPNTKRLRELDVGETVKACVIAGPADLMAWEVSACTDVDGMSLDVVGRGSDMEAAAASVMAILTENGSTLAPSVDDTHPLTEASAASPSSGSA